MNECWDEGALRAYLDRELPAEKLAGVAAHLGDCAACHGRYNELAARAARVSSTMSVLAAPVAVLPMPSPPNRRWVQPMAAALVLAAAAALLLVWMPRRAARPRPLAPPLSGRIERPIQAETQPLVQPRAHPAAARTRLRRAIEAPQTDDYLALDDEPIDVGVVMRVALDSAAAVQADVIFDAEGRPRAIRPIKQLSK
jgi:hypothetical protein